MRYLHLRHDHVDSEDRGFHAPPQQVAAAWDGLAPVAVAGRPVIHASRAAELAEARAVPGADAQRSAA